MEVKKSSLWTRNFTCFFITNFFMSLGTQFLTPSLPLFAMNSLGATQAQVGYLLGVYSLAALVIRPYAGYAYDFIGRKKTYIVALAFFTLVTFSYPFTATFFLLVLFRSLHGLAFGVTSTGGGTIVGDILPPDRRGEGVGYFGLANTLSMALGPAIGLWIVGKNEFLNLFIISGILICLAFVMSNFISLTEREKPTKAPTLNSFVERRVFAVSGIMLMMGIVFGGVLSYITVYSKEIGIENGGLYFLVNAVGVAVTRFFAGRIQDKKGPKPVIIFGFTSLVVGFAVLSISNGLGLFLTAALLLGLGNGTIMPTLQTMVINMVEPESRGVANSTFFAATDIGIGGGSILLGWISGLTSLKTMFMLSAFFILIPFVVFMVYTLKDYEKKLIKLEAEVIV